jgi:DNA polymerase-1
MNSSKQLGEFLYGKLGLPVLARTPKGAPSTKKEVIEALLSNPSLTHPALGVLRSFKQADKTRSTFLSDELIAKVAADPEQRIKTTYKVTGTVTGRLSSEQPNLQNIPRGPMVRQLFVAPPGFVFAAPDFSQAELRVAAYMAREQNLIDMFENNRDVHRETAAKIFGIPAERITDEQRVMAKFVVFGWLYGRGWASVMNQYRISEQLARGLLNGFEQQNPNLVRWKNWLIDFAAKNRYIQNPFGRRRAFPLYGPFLPDWEREALNFNPQSTVSDVCLRSMILITKYFKENGFKSCITMNLHDAIMFDIHESEIERASYVIKRVMELPVPSLGIGIPVELKMGKYWEEWKQKDKEPEVEIAA